MFAPTAAYRREPPETTTVSMASNSIGFNTNLSSVPSLPAIPSLPATPNFGDQFRFLGDVNNPTSTHDTTPTATTSSSTSDGANIGKKVKSLDLLGF